MDDPLRALILFATVRVERERRGWQIARQERENPMARDLQSLEQALGIFDLEMDGAAGAVFDKMDAVRAKSVDVFRRTHARVDARAQTVDRVDQVLTSLDRSNSGNPTSAGSSTGSQTSSAPPPPPVDSAEKKS